ncbi:NAD(P)/FAD-dependent oxidoreductase [Actinosynnema sp. NPDC020468]|uniref:phytoene desaturase family protein n=1 Tax=Actinosynnema sp. NPDC020468 TaxID=3154488 RepID=UPI0033DB5F74
MSDDVDAVVVGGGPNGLVAANVLADAGWEVLVVEAADEVGGAVRSADGGGGVTRDLFSAFYPLGAASPVLRGLELERHGLVWRHAPEVLAHVLPDDRAVLLSRDVDTTAKSVEAFGVGDGDAWHAEFDRWRVVRDGLLDALLRPFPPVRGATRLLRDLGAGDALRLARSLALPVRTFGTERFAGQGAPLLLAGNAMHTDLGPDQAGGTAFGWLLSMLGQDVGFPVPEGGAGALTAALVHRLNARVDTGRRVTDIVIADGRALGIRDADGGLVRARKAVLADVPAPTLYLDLVDARHLPSRLLADVKAFHWDDATIKVDWTLSSPIPWTATEARRAGTVHLGGDLNGLASAAAELANRRVPRHPFLIMGQMTTSDPTRSPDGTEVVWGYTHVPRGDAWSADRLRRRADRLEQLVEQHAPGFRDTITARHVQGPAELEETNRSLVGGSINQGTAALHQQLVFRPTPGLGRADTPVDRLFLAGSSAHPGGGVHGAAGANAARAALARNGMAGEAYRLLMSGLHRALHADRR